MCTESCNRRLPSDDFTSPQYDVTTRRYDNDDDDDDVMGDYSGHAAVAGPTPAITHQSAVREPGRRAGTWPGDVNTSGLWSETDRKSETASGAVAIGPLYYWSTCVVSAHFIVSARL